MLTRDFEGSQIECDPSFREDGVNAGSLGELASILPPSRLGDPTEVSRAPLGH